MKARHGLSRRDLAGCESSTLPVQRDSCRKSHRMESGTATLFGRPCVAAQRVGRATGADGTAVGLVRAEQLG